jgi:glycopeptide antibiotics resistance protein
MFRLTMTLYTENYGYSLTNYFIGLLIAILIIALIRTRSLSYVICAAIFGVYLLFVIDNAFFPLHIRGNFADSMRAMPFIFGVNLIPFRFSPYSELSSIIRELGLNLALLVPFGFGISFLFPVREKHIVWLAPGVGASIEAIQLVISLIVGYPYRTIDITDVIMNTSGFLVGYAIFRLFVWWYLALTQRFHIKHVGLGRYIYMIAHPATDPINKNPLSIG